MSEMEALEQRIDPANDNNLFLSAFIIMTQNGFHEEANPLVGLCITTWVEHQMWDSPLKDMVYGEKKRTRAMFAAKAGRLERLKWFIKRRADLHNADSDGRACLHHACEEGHLMVVRELIDSNVNVNAVNVNAEGDLGYSPLMEAIKKGHTLVLQMLIAHGADVNQTRGRNGDSSLIIASRVGSLEAVRALLGSGARVNYCDDRGSSALSDAPTMAIRELLLQHGAACITLDPANPLRRIAGYAYLPLPGQIEQLEDSLQVGQASP
jgi:Ankyrin repeats (3 copies)